MTGFDLQWFSAEDEGRTEEGSETKLRKARDEGRVAKSQELNGTIVFLLVTLTLILLGKWIYNNIARMMIFYFSNVTAFTVTDGKFFALFFECLLKCVLPLAVVGLSAGVVANIVQNKGWIYTTKTIEPKFSKIVPKFGEYFKKTLMSVMAAFNIIKSLAKIIVIGLTSFVFIRKDLVQTMDMIRTSNLEHAFFVVSKMVMQILLVSAIILLIISVVDYVMQCRDFREQMKMTKQQVKEEFKENEGDPEVKSRLEAAQKDMLKQNMPKAVREADVVIANPTHFAVSLQWKRDQAAAPQITAKGEDETALKMRKIAAENNVPVVENRALARELYAHTEVGDIIPFAYMSAIAIVYSQIGYMDKQYSKK